MNLADILKEIGNEGLFQVLAVLILAMPKLPMQWSMTMMSYASYEPEWCCVPEDVDVDSKCEMHRSSPTTNDTVISYLSTSGHCDLNSTICSQYVYLDSYGASTAVTEWDLLCDRQWIVSALSSIQMGGVLVGALLCGFLADIFGRKKVHFITIAVHAVLNLGAGISNSWVLFAAFRFLIGAAIGSYLVVHVPYILEFLSPRWRVVPASLPFGAIGASLLPLAAWLLPDWRWMHFICALLCLPFLAGHWFMPESMRWLTVKGKVLEAAKVVHKIAKVNRREYDAAKCHKKMARVARREKKLLEKGKNYTYLDVYRGWKMARLTLTLQFVWFTTSLVGYGIILGISNLAGNVFVNMFLVEAVEIPFIMATSYFSNCIGRRYTALIYFSLATATAFLAFLFNLIPSMPNRDMAITMMCICCRTFIAGAAAVFIVVSTEVYPTVIRTLGYGAANTAAKVGGVLAPFIINIDSIPTGSYSVMFITCLLCVFAVLSLAETRDMLMEDTLEKKGSIISLMSSLTVSLDQTSSAPRPPSRVILDIDTDLIHHRSYSEFEEENVDDDDDFTPGIDTVQLVEGAGKSKKKEKTPLMQSGRPMYDPSLASSRVQKSRYGGQSTGSLDATDGVGRLEQRRGYANDGFGEDEEKPAQRPKFYQSQSVSVDNDPSVVKHLDVTPEAIPEYDTSRNAGDASAGNTDKSGLSPVQGLSSELQEIISNSVKLDDNSGKYDSEYPPLTAQSAWTDIGPGVFGESSSSEGSYLVGHGCICDAGDRGIDRARVQEPDVLDKSGRQKEGTADSQEEKKTSSKKDEVSG